MKKINIGIYGSEGRMGKDIISRARDFKEIEIGSFVSPKWVPQMADSEIIIDKIVNITY